MILLALFCILIAGLYIINKRQNSYWKLKGIPSIDPLPLVGNMLDSVMLKKTSGENIEDFYKKFVGLPYFGLYQFTEKVIIVRDVALAKKIFTTDFNYFQNNAFEIEENDESLAGKGPFFLKGERWREVRKIMSNAFSSGKIKLAFPSIIEVCDEFIEFLTSDNAKDGVEIREASGKFTTDVVATSAFGLKAESLSNPKAVFRQMGNKIFHKDLSSALKNMIVFMFPTLGKLFKTSFVPIYVAHWFKRVIKDTIQFRKDNNVVREDFLQAMMQVQDNLTEKKFTLEDITGLCLTFLTDGFETSSYVTAFALYEIAANKEIQDKVRKEVEQAISHHDGKLTYESLIGMQYMESVIYETLRKYPIIGMLMKSCTKEYTFPPVDGGTGPGLTISPGTIVGIPIHAIYRDPEYFPNPLKFDPDRHLDEEAKQKFRNAFYAFGDGPRVCIAKRFAMVQAKACIASILLKLDIRLAKKMKEPVVLSPLSFMPAARDGLWLTFHHRL